MFSWIHFLVYIDTLTDTLRPDFAHSGFVITIYIKFQGSYIVRLSEVTLSTKHILVSLRVNSDTIGVTTDQLLLNQSS